MIIFKANYERAWDINGIKIVCKKDCEEYDFVLEGVYEDNLMLLRICLRTVLINPDKRYKLKFGGATVLPNPYMEETCGVIDVNKLVVEKHCKYMHNNIVSFCLYGEKEMYIKGALRNIEQYGEKYKDSTCYFYVRNDVSEETLVQLKKKGVVVECIDMVDWYMMFTRFLPFENPENKFYLSRDCDCRLIHREEKAIEEWLESDKKFHIIRDHPWHNTLILGGMWGSRDLNQGNLRLLIMQWCLHYLKLNESKEKGPDQYFLKNLYNLVKPHIMVHDEFFTYEDMTNIIDAPRNNKEYIGEAYDENDEILDQSLRNVIT
tara:strand:- start:1324 stop:2280 length:957 start_codon:yes stop_codon:yes gene_type:complete